MWAYSVLPSNPSLSWMTSTVLPEGFQVVLGYHASMSSNLQVHGIRSTAQRLSSSCQVYSLKSPMGGFHLVVLSRSLPIMSSTAVMLHLVGTKRLLRPTPIVPTEKAFWISDISVPFLYAETTASAARMSVS